MNNRRNLLILALLVAGIVALAAVLRQWALPGDAAVSQPVIFAQDYTLSGALDDALVVVATENIHLEAGSRVGGDAALIGRGEVRISGQIGGRLTVMGDRLVIEPGSRIAGEVIFLGGEFEIAGTLDSEVTAIGRLLTAAPTARVAGEITACVDTLAGSFEASQPRRCAENEALAGVAPLLALRDGISLSGIPAGELIWTLPLALGLVALAALAVAAFPRRFNRIETALRARPRRLALTGGVTLLAVAGVIAALVILLALLPPAGVALIPLGLLLLLALALVVITGWTTLALLIGGWAFRRLSGSPQPPLLAALLGGLILCLAGYALALAPYGVLAGLLGLAIMAIIGLGAVLTTSSLRPGLSAL